MKASTNTFDDDFLCKYKVTLVIIWVPKVETHDVKFHYT